MADLLTNIQEHLAREFATAYDSGARRFDFMGGRRSGKTYFILQYLLSRMYLGDVVSVATMTDTQGRLGAYQDAKDIVHGSLLQPYCEVLSSPREIRCANGGRMFFNSYQSSERAKGIACDWLYINEANNFTEQQYIDLAASTRKGVFADRNPNAQCWTERNGFALLHSTWRDNKANLTDQQREWFEQLKAKAEAPTATAADKAFYRMYYLGEYAELTGEIFTPANIQRCDSVPTDLQDMVAHCDPSAMWGADWFACNLSGCKDGKMYVVDAYSINIGHKQDIIAKLREWQARYKDLRIVIETNGAIGQEFYTFAEQAFPNLEPVNQSKNKFQRIMANYENICNNVIFATSDVIDAYLEQVYTFAERCEHDDNIDAINTAYDIHRWAGYL